jgi:hypothetical protein
LWTGLREMYSKGMTIIPCKFPRRYTWAYVVLKAP